AGPDLRRGYWPRWPPNRPEAQVDARTDGGRRARVWPHRPPGGARFSRRARGRRLRHQRFSSDREPGIRGTGSEARRVMILVTGAAGLSGSAVVRELAKQRITVRALVRDSAKARGLRELPGVEVHEGDMFRPETLDRALEGVTKALMISS